MMRGGYSTIIEVESINAHKNELIIILMHMSSLTIFIIFIQIPF